ncbi:hypothetical protein [Formosa sp. L2A11]|uniref:hypothetical protein n=1 Tax=Formosa sp. L2A11 TaxID=2686363 RepID=UPI00131A8A57|nr:hypothetical protein [Formosa sp. L2A11]
MASNNFENNIKKNLEERRLQPSAQSWNQLQSQLNTQEDKQSSKRYWFIGIAASFIGVLLLSTWMFTSNSNPDLQVVDTETTIKNTEAVIDSSASNLEELVALPKEEVVETVKEAIASKVVSSAKINKSTSVVASSLDKKEEKNTSKELNSIIEDTVLNSALVHEEEDVSEDYIEDLLQQAEQQIVSEKALKESQQTVNSKTLLESVENDIEYSFREKVFDAVKSGFVKVKTAVVERNN